MRTKEEYLQKIKQLFTEYLKNNSQVFDRHCYNNDDYEEYIDTFFESLGEEGVSISNCYHAYGIGNNHEYQLFKREVDNDGFAIEKKIATFKYTAGIYGGVYVCLKDCVTGQVIDEFGRAR